MLNLFFFFFVARRPVLCILHPVQHGIPRGWRNLKLIPTMILNTLPLLSNRNARPRFRGVLRNLIGCQCDAREWDIDTILEWASERTGTALVQCQGEIADADDTSCCERCEDTVFSDDTSSVHLGRRREDNWCESCADDHAFTCADCDEIWDNDANDIANDTEGDRVCPSCAESYFYCEGCGDTFHTNNYGQDGRCSSCSEPDEDEDGIPGYHSTPRCYSTGNRLCFGVELELKAKSSSTLADVYSAATDYGLIGERDGSLDAELGIELVAKPLSLTGNLELWLPLLDELRGKCVGWDAGTGYGMHVSINRTALSSFHQGKLLVFVNGNKELCEHVAGRAETHWAKYAKKHIRDAKKTSGEKYEALSMRSSSRLEMRIFRSTLSAEGFSRNVEFAAACVEFARNAGIQQLTDHDFKSWLSADGRPKSYPALYAHLFPDIASKRATAKASFATEGGN